jgi:hypothetical protein
MLVPELIMFTFTLDRHLRRQTLILDTGSRLTAFPCDPCTNCGRHVFQILSSWLVDDRSEPQLWILSVEGSLKVLGFSGSMYYIAKVHRRKLLDSLRNRRLGVVGICRFGREP